MSTTQITIRLPDERVEALKRQAKDQHRSIAQQIEHRLAMADRAEKGTDKLFGLFTPDEMAGDG